MGVVLPSLNSGMKMLGCIKAVLGRWAELTSLPLAARSFPGPSGGGQQAGGSVQPPGLRGGGGQDQGTSGATSALPGIAQARKLKTKYS